MQIHLTGAFEPSDKGRLAEGSAHLDKKCLLVYVGKFDSMDGEVQIRPEDIHRLADEHNSTLSKLKRLAGAGDVPLRFMPPLQLDHSTSARDTVGRLVGPMEVGEHQLEDGSKVPALYGTARVLGKENVERVQDGRWAHLSIGADLNTAKLTELTITPFPAAQEASMLSRGIKMKAAHKIEEYKANNAGPVKYKYHIIVDGKPVYSSEGFDQFEECEHEALDAVKRIGDNSTTLSADGSVQMPGHPDEALWKKAKDASQKAFGEVRWPFVMWWYKKQGGKLSAEAPEGEEKMHEHLKAHLKHLGVPEEKHEEVLGRMKKHLAAHLGVDEEKAEEHMKKLSADLWDAHAKHMAKSEGPDAEPMPHSESVVDMHGDDEEAEKLKSHHLTAAGRTARVIALRKSMDQRAKKIELAARRGKITARLASLRMSAKITPAEVKKLDLVKLASMNDAGLDAMFSAFDAREPVVFVGAMGTSKAEDVSKLAADQKKAARLKSLEKSMRANMSSVPKEAGAEEDHLAEAPQAAHGAPAEVPAHEDLDADYDHLKHLIGEEKHEEAKEHLKHMLKKHLKHLSGDEAGEGEHQLAEVADEVKKMRAEAQELAQLIGA